MTLPAAAESPDDPEPPPPYLPPPAPPLPDEVERDAWHRLSARMIGVDLARAVLSALPALIAIALGIDPAGGGLWPLVGVAIFGAAGAVIDALRWVFTRFRITDSHVELRSGMLLRVHRSIQRERIRSVDAEAKLRHRLGGLRVVVVGAGQQRSAGESALRLDAVSVADARALQRTLLHPDARPEAPSADPEVSGAGEPVPVDPPDDGQVAEPPADQPLVVFAGFEPRWVVYNVLNLWTYVVVLGVGWGAVALLGGFGIDVVGLVGDVVDWDAIGWAGTTAIALVAATLLGVLSLAIVYVTEYWGFELARVRGQEGTVLRTRRGLFTTREVNRAERRIRGMQLSEPLLWRWMHAADTTVITTGLSLWAPSQPAVILPRSPVADARRIAADVLEATGPDDPFVAPLAGRPRASLRRRLTWATGATVALALLLGWLAVTEVVPASVVGTAVVAWPAALLAAWVAYRALGHAVVGRYLVTRSGVLARRTTALQRDAVSTVIVRESLLQRRLGLRSLVTTTAAGHGTYATPDLDADTCLELASAVAPELLAPFREDR